MEGVLGFLLWFTDRTEWFVFMDIMGRRSTMMTSNNEHRARNFFQKGFHSLGEYERKAVDTILHRFSHAEADSTKLTIGQHLADKVASFGGSWTFIMLFAGFLVIWVILNSILLTTQEVFDPYPYILLNLFLSMIAALQAPIIMMSQNRQSVNDRKDAKEDFEVNLKSEMEILSLHEKMDDLRVQKWQELIEIQQDQIRMLTTMFQKHLDEEHGQGTKE
jgi:uncharacterized membrane protein